MWTNASLHVHIRTGTYTYKIYEIRTCFYTKLLLVCNLSYLKQIHTSTSIALYICRALEYVDFCKYMFKGSTHKYT